VVVKKEVQELIKKEPVVYLEPDKKIIKVKDVRTECCKCKKAGTNANLVRCDECSLCFHFQCLSPPVRKSPKQRGYNWHCENCDPSEKEDQVDSD